MFLQEELFVQREKDVKKKAVDVSATKPSIRFANRHI